MTRLPFQSSRSVVAAVAMILVVACGATDTARAPAPQPAPAPPAPREVARTTSAPMVAEPYCCCQVLDTAGFKCDAQVTVDACYAVERKETTDAGKVYFTGPGRCLSATELEQAITRTRGHDFVKQPDLELGLWSGCVRECGLVGE